MLLVACETFRKKWWHARRLPLILTYDKVSDTSRRIGCCWAADSRFFSDANQKTTVIV